MAADVLKANKVLTKAQFRQRAAHILTPHTLPQAGHQYSSLWKLALGMPERLQLCKNNRCGLCRN